MKTAQQSSTKASAKASAPKSAKSVKGARKTTGKSAQGKAAKEADPLSMCPVNGAGWCPYPFSVAQLKRRLKAKEEAAKAAASKNSD